MVVCWNLYLTDPPQDVKFGLTQPEQSVAADQSDESAHLTVRIIARRVPDGRIEFGLRSPNGDLFPSARYFPALGPRHEGWLRSSAIEIGDGFQGRIIARFHALDGRTEFGFRVEGYDDIFLRQKFFPAAALADRPPRMRLVAADAAIAIRRRTA